MKPQRVDPMTGILNYLGSLKEIIIDPEVAFEKNRATATCTELYGDTITVDTCRPLDTNIYETGIKRTNVEGKWIIAEQYPDADKARESSHTKIIGQYVKMGNWQNSLPKLKSPSKWATTKPLKTITLTLPLPLWMLKVIMRIIEKEDKNGS